MIFVERLATADPKEKKLRIFRLWASNKPAPSLNK